MGQQNEAKKAKVWSNSNIVAAFITGIFSVIAALIGAYAVLAAVGKAPVLNSFDNKTSPIDGTWVGTISASDQSSRTQVTFSIQSNCVVGQACGTYQMPVYGCGGDLIYNSVTQDVYEFTEKKSGSAPDFCKTNTIDRFSAAGDELKVSSLYSEGQGLIVSNGTLRRK